jgi:mono/diheme cytochrome c family protein
VIMQTRPFSLPFLAAVILIAASPSFLFGSKKKDAEKAGAVLFRDKGCAYCHGVGAVGGKKAPSLLGLPNDKAWPSEKITDQVLNGGQKMPPFRESVTDEEVSQLVAYLRAKNKPVPPPAQTPPPAPAGAGPGQ